MSRYTRLHNPPTYQPFPAPPELPFIPSPVNKLGIQDGIYSYSSTGFSLMGYRPKRPSELLAAMSEQYDEKEYDRYGQEKRGSRGKKKQKQFFKAHLTWYGIEYDENDSRQELEEKLWNAMSARPPPTLPQEIFDIEAVMRERWMNASEARNREIAETLVQQGHTIYNSPLLADVTGLTSLTDDFFTDPRAFLRKHFPPTAPRTHVVVLMGVDTASDCEVDVYEWACDVFKLRVEKVENNRGRGFNRGRYADFVIGRDPGSVRAKAEEIRAGNASASGARFR
ncbi:hypothetical protein CVT26_012895, partial [Gymnopilus dilepis]